MSDKSLLDIAKAVPKKEYKPKGLAPGKSTIEKFIKKYLYKSKYNEVLAEHIYNKYLKVKRDNRWHAMAFNIFCREMTKHLDSKMRKKGRYFLIDGSGIDQSEEAFWEVRKYIREYGKYAHVRKKAKEKNKKKQK